MALSSISYASNGAPTDAAKDAQKAETSSYSLMNPMPENEMGNMSSDRIGRIQSANTVAPGHFQAEFDAVNYAYEKSTAIHHTQVMPITLKAGLAQDVDAAISVNTYSRYSNDTASVQGFGNIATSLKFTAWHQDGMSLAIAPTVSFPTAQKEIRQTTHVEGGLAVPFTAALPADFNLGIVAAANYHNSGTALPLGIKDVRWNLDSGLSLSHNIMNSLGGYLGFVNSQALVKDSKWMASANAGLTYDVSRDFAIDAGSQFGLTASAEDVNPYIGAAVRF